MPNALMDRAHGWLGGRDDTHWDESKKRWTFASGATLSSVVLPLLVSHS